MAKELIMSKKLLFILSVICLIWVGCEPQYGEITKQSHGNIEYTAISCNFPLEIHFSKNATEIVTVLHEELQQSMILSCVDGCLDISMDKLYNKSWEVTPRIIMPIPSELNSIQGYASLVIDTDTTISTSKLKLNVAGNSKVQMILDADSLIIESLGYGTVFELHGDAEAVKIESNSLVMNALSMTSKTYECDIYDSQLDIQCSDTLRINNMNNSTLRYKGNCEVLQNNVWSSTIQQID